MDKKVLERLSDEVLRLVDLYEMLEVTDEVTEDNPAFEFICGFTDNFFNALLDLMVELACQLPEDSPIASKVDTMLAGFADPCLDDFEESFLDGIVGYEDDEPKFE